MKLVTWYLSLGSMPEVDAEDLTNDCIECQLLSPSLHTEDLVVGLVRYRLIPVQESLQWRSVLFGTATE